MYTGGRISRLFSTVAGPFHPFGGAVDIIVVQQQDGSFKSTPWYVKFGKFQGVLKRSEAIVTVAVNGVDANFHLYLDNTGEAYFLKEIESFDEDEDYSPRSSDSSNDAMIIGNDSFKSVMSHEADGQHDDRYGDEDKESEKYSPVKGGSDICYKNNDMVVSVSDNGSFLESSTTEKCGCSGDASRNGGADSKHSENCWESRVEASMLIVDGSIGAFEMSSRKSQNGTLFLSGFNEYEYENLEFQQMENTESRKAENDNSEMILMTGDGHMMTAPISSFKNSMYLCNETQAGKSECSPADGNHVGQATDLGLEISGENNDMESKEETSRHSHSSDLDEVMSNDSSCSGSGSQPKEEDLSNMEDIMSNDNSCNGTKKQSTEDHPSNLEDTASNESSCSGTERRSKESTGNSFASPERNSKERNDDLQTRQLENCSEDSGHQMIRNESDLEFGFNDDEIYKSCANFSELYSPIDEEGEKHESLSPHPEEDEEEYGVTCNKEDNIESHDLSRFSSNKSSPMAVPRLRATARDAREISGSMPNMVLHFSHTEIPVNDGFCSRSFDSVYSPCQKTSDQATFADSKELNSSTRGSFLGSESSTPRHGISDSKVETSDKTDHTNLHNSIGRDITDEDVKHKMDIEISLCRDLLYKGMGREAAAHAFESRKVSKEEFKNSTATVMKNEKLVVKIKGRYFPWSEAAPLVLGLVAFDVELPAQHAGEILVDDPDSKAGNNRSSDSGATSGGGWRLWPFSFRRPRTPDTSISVSAQVNTERKVEENGDSSSRLKNSYKKQQKHKVRTNSPTSDQLASLNLKEGQNMITFTVLTSVWGKQQVDARIYLWKWNTKIVISDVDGTITKSDVLGQVMPWVGKDWSQTGVARFFSAIKDNGYQLLFLSARAIAQAYLTRQFLLNLKQDGKKLPDGPVVISPDGLFPSLYREVIRRAPHEFKISCLEDIRALFPPDVNPFYAGFGNRDTDEISYLKVGIPKGKIFIINPKGQVVVNNCVDVKSYTSLHNLADDMFPPPVSSCEQEDFNSWNYWKVPLPAIED